MSQPSWDGSTGGSWAFSSSLLVLLTICCTCMGCMRKGCMLHSSSWLLLSRSEASGGMHLGSKAPALHLGSSEKLHKLRSHGAYNRARRASAGPASFHKVVTTCAQQGSIVQAVNPDFKVGWLQNSMAAERSSQLPVNMVNGACECRALLLWETSHTSTIMKVSEDAVYDGGRRVYSSAQCSMEGLKTTYPGP